ncbi:hypothetical protein [Ferriphaselus sp. R-1]|uniref:hypothetical protein n=1 Tax=Ferriphaselus sp. R-1 TaxID=1485544 RepID=UPI001377CAF5|nr:hypothetical protein [Ferriphaselus sp. R-1]
MLEFFKVLLTAVLFAGQGLFHHEQGKTNSDNHSADSRNGSNDRHSSLLLELTTDTAKPGGNPSIIHPCGKLSFIGEPARRNQRRHIETGEKMRGENRPGAVYLLLNNSKIMKTEKPTAIKTVAAAEIVAMMAIVLSLILVI